MKFFLKLPENVRPSRKDLDAAETAGTGHKLGVCHSNVDTDADADVDVDVDVYADTDQCNVLHWFEPSDGR